MNQKALMTCELWIKLYCGEWRTSKGFYRMTLC